MVAGGKNSQRLSGRRPPLVAVWVAGICYVLISDPHVTGDPKHHEGRLRTG